MADRSEALSITNAEACIVKKCSNKALHCQDLPRNVTTLQRTAGLPQATRD